MAVISSSYPVKRLKESIFSSLVFTAFLTNLSCLSLSGLTKDHKDPASLFVCSSNKDCSPSTSYYSPQQLSVETFYSFHRNLYPTPTLHEIYSEIHYYFFLFVNLSQGQFLKIYTISNCLCCVSL